MSLSHWQRTIVDDAGNVRPSASVEVRNESTGSLVNIKSNREGTTGKDNPFLSDAGGFADFYAPGGAYKIVVTSGAFSQTWRYVALGTSQELDAVTLQGLSGIRYTRSTLTTSSPIPGYVQGDAPNLIGASFLYFSSFDGNGNDQTDRIIHFGDSTSAIRGFLTLRKLSGSSDIVFRVVGAVLDQRDNSPPFDALTIPVSLENGVDGLLDHDEFTIDFSRTGDKGDVGVAGVAGATGATGDPAEWFTGSADPSGGNGTNGDFYLQTGVGSIGIVGDVWTKAAGIWSITGNIRGATGASGAGTGDVVGPVSATDEAVARFDTTTGQLIQNSAAFVSDTGVITAGSTAATAMKLDPSGFVEFPEVAAPGTPASGFIRLYGKSDNKMYRKDDAGIETELGAGASGNLDYGLVTGSVTGTADYGSVT